MQDYHWPHRDAVTRLNAILRLPATGREQDWEIEMADEARATEWLELFRNGQLGIEERAALALLITHSVYCPNCPEETPEHLVKLTRSALRDDLEVRRRMISYWNRGGWIEESPEIARMLG